MVKAWKRVKLGDVAVNSTAATKDYESDGYTRYIIGKHIPENGRITTWNPVGDAEFGSRIRTMVQKGDVICTTRGPKLKVAVADFDCLSAHTNFILRPKDERILLPGILEAIVRSDGFQDHLRKHFRGSTNLFVNWSDAAQYEFALPPLDEQRRMIPALICAGQSVAAASALVEQSKTLVRSALDAIFDFPGVPKRGLVKPPKGWELRQLSELADPKRPISYGILMPGDSVPNGVPMLRVMDFDEFGRRTSTEVLRVDRSVADRSVTTYARAGDLVVSVMATIGRSFVVQPDMDGWNMNRALTLVPCSDPRVAKLIHAYFQSGFVQRLLSSEKIGSAQARINLADLKTLPVPVPPSPEMVLAVSERVFATLEAAERRHRAVLALTSALLAEVLG